MSVPPVKSHSASAARRGWTAALQAVLLALLLLVGMGSPMALAAPQVSTGTAGTLGIAPPDVSAKAVYALDMTSGAVLYAKNADAKLPIASITKVITALVTVNHVGLTEQVTIAQKDLLDPNSTFTKMNLRAGDVLSVADLLEGLLLPSGGDAANALARYVGGKLANTTDGNAALTAFIDEMNAYAKSLGLSESYFTNVAGDDDQGAFSSAHDLAIIGSQLMKNADLAWMVAQPSMQVASQNGDPYALTNTNKMLQSSDPEYDPNVVGIKTGSTEGAGASVLLARKANDGQSTVILVVLGSTLEYDENYTIVTDQRWADAASIFSDMDQRFTWTQVDASSFPGLQEQLAVWGLELHDTPVIPLDKDATFQLVVPPPGSDQQGEVVIYSGDSELASIPVYASGTAGTGG
ncbi:MAG TPA: serine hydrolase [Thermomicrobiales bacterium]|nr:serine hydrolase [Thermomicrobiales bacterium]